MNYQNSWQRLSFVLSLVKIIILVNNYEVDLILQSYLKLWMKDPGKPGIPCMEFLQSFKQTFEGLIRMFFEDSIFIVVYYIQIEMIDYNSYFVFVCVYTFFGKNRILQLLISQAKIYSNKLVTYAQITYFLNRFCFSGDIIHLVFLLITPLPDNHSVYKMNDFISVIKSLNDYRIMIDGLRDSLISMVLSEKIFENISTKVTFIYSINDPSFEVLDDSDKNNSNNNNTEKDDDMDDDIDIYGTETRIVKEKEKLTTKKPEKEKLRSNVFPKEPCFSKVIRIIFTNIPPPYSYDYYLISPDKYSFDNIIYNLKHKNGYGHRGGGGGDSSARSMSFKKIMSFRKNSTKSTVRSQRNCINASTSNTSTKNNASHLNINISNINSTFTGEHSLLSKRNTNTNQVIISNSILQGSINNNSTKDVERISITRSLKHNAASNKIGLDKTPV